MALAPSMQLQSHAVSSCMTHTSGHWTTCASYKLTYVSMLIGGSIRDCCCSNTTWNTTCCPFLATVSRQYNAIALPRTRQLLCIHWVDLNYTQSWHHSSVAIAKCHRIQAVHALRGFQLRGRPQVNAGMAPPQAVLHK